MIRSPALSSAARRGLPLSVVTALVAAATANAQSLAFASRNTQHVAACGAVVGGPGAQHSFSSSAATHDVIAVSDPGAPTMTWSQATSQIDSVLTPTGLALAISGDAARGPLSPFGAAAYAAGREQWTVTLTATAHVQVNALLSAASTDPSSMPPVSFSVLPASAGASITPDPGSAPTPWALILASPGNQTFVSRGTLTPGQYIVYIESRAEGSSFAYPFSGSYSASVALAIGAPAAATPRNAGTNPQSYTCTLPTLGQTWQGTVDPTTTGHGAAALFFSLVPAQSTLPTGQTVLIAGPLIVFGGPVFAAPATFSLAVPLDNTLAGLAMSTQAIHFLTAPGFALSNANDLTFGF